MQFLLIFGPPAVGKMAVGRVIEDRTGIRLFHNHLSIEPILPFFPFGSPSFNRLVRNFREAFFAEVAQSDRPGICFTFVWDFASRDDLTFVTEVCGGFEAAGADIALIELKASLEQRLVRNRSADRLREKPSKRNIAQSEKLLLELDGSGRQMNSAGPLLLPYKHIVLDNTNVSAHAAADVIISTLGLRTHGA